jgi:hypothetical protein
MVQISKNSVLLLFLNNNFHLSTDIKENLSYILIQYSILNSLKLFRHIIEFPFKLSRSHIVKSFF